jgi:pectate lyase
MLADNFEGDALGSTPAGWSGYRINCVWNVQTQGTHVLTHSGWAGSQQIGSASWSNYAYSVDVKPSAWASEQDGLIFAVSEAGRYSLDIVGGNQLVLGKWAGGTWTQLASAPYTFSSYRWYNLSVAMPGGSIIAYVNGTQMLRVSDSTFSSGAVGLEANDPVAFDNVVVTALGVWLPPAPPSPPRL